MVEQSSGANQVAGGFQCQFRLENRNRLCTYRKMLKDTPSKYCIAHAYLDTNVAYVRCPHEPKQMMPAADLEEHLKVCPKLRAINLLRQQIFFREDCNILRAGGIKQEPGAQQEISFIMEAYAKASKLHALEFPGLFDVEAQAEAMHADHIQKVVPSLKHGN